MKKTIFHLLQLSWLMLGLFLFGLSIVLIIQAQLGISPWDVLHMGLTSYLPFTFGQIMIGTGLLCVLLAYPMGVKPSSGTILNMIFIGVFADIILNQGWIPAYDSYLVRLLYLFIGVMGCGFATGMYISARMGTGPRDSLMVGLHKITGWRIGVVRTAIELTVVGLGFLLGGPVGLGTVVFSLSIGWATEFSMHFFKYCGRQEWIIKHLGQLNPGLLQKNQT
ncbi:YczE/YyaS/YitT family protein [Desulforamulus ferrireducens]|uniref:Membrane protein n=1 Tax=Desulforamulus ferrireducens TaxID=1833852 RepID=A0A1S6IYM8_9FIRM|nr:membrane protein [Desulforamulus ferrireducens]AQS59860.1 membrane protein [Desulforamulus ferrireducens]